MKVLVAGATGAQISLRPAEINGCPGVILISPGGGVVGAMALESDGERVLGINSVVNPDKLKHLGRVESVSGSVAQQGPSRRRARR
jgi:RNA polymerase sigma-70 factor, ECF subfamily